MITELDVFGNPIHAPCRVRPGRVPDPSPDWGTAEDLALWILVPEILTENQYLNFCQWLTRKLGREPVADTHTPERHLKDCYELCRMRFRTRHMDRKNPDYFCGNEKLLNLAGAVYSGSASDRKLAWGAHELFSHYIEKRREAPDAACDELRLSFLMNLRPVSWGWIRQVAIGAPRARHQPARASVEFDELYHPLLQFLHSPGDADSVRATATALRQAARAVFSRPC